MKFRYLGKCTAGFVAFKKQNEAPVVMPEGAAVEVPAWLAAKLKTNSHFEQVAEEESAPVQSGEVVEMKPKRGRKPKAVSDPVAA